MKKLLIYTLCLLLIIPVHYASEDVVSISYKMLDYALAVDEKSAIGFMDDELAAQLKGKLAPVFIQLKMFGGDYMGAKGEKLYEKSGLRVVEIGMNFSKMKFIQRTAFNEEGKMTGLVYMPGVIVETEVLPENLKEENISFYANEKYPLDGKITTPKEGEVLAGIVLVHGSGPNDMDETIGVNKPFADLAYGLASKGFAVLRYDKRTLTHGAEMAKAEDYIYLTIDEETTNDAAAAVEFLSKKLGDDKKILLLGHSMGAMLASYIGSKTDSIDGYILMAGTPQKLWELIIDQNKRALNEMEEKPENMKDFIKTEDIKANNLANLSDDEALKEENSVFTMSAWYLRHMDNIDAVALHMQDMKPVLVLQGEKDRQVTMKDFELFKQGLEEHRDAKFISYPALNHVFGEYKGDEVPFMELMNKEYMQKTPVPKEVTDDIAAWISERL
ncbi:MAG TPA: alpha/beta fold hydrolase [Christensenellaceae bacterium]|jgi:dienelactone hydrolase|nr:alpha/beta fold hydrolase [Christensenellaceae bacterium]